jgi:hypothetical protein
LVTRGIKASSALSLAALVTSFASCASEGAASAPSDPFEASTLPEASPLVDAAEAGIPGAGCDVVEANCTFEIVSCDRVAWCMTKTDVSVLYTLVAVWGTSKDDVWAAGSGGTIIHYDGTNWTATPSGVHNTFYAIWGSGPNDVWLVSSTEVILHGTGWKGAATTWTNVPTDLGKVNVAFVGAVWGSSANDVRLGGRAFELPPGRGDQFVKSELADGGISWLPRRGTQAVASIWGSSADDVWMTAQDGTYTLHGKPVDAGANAVADPFDDRLTWTAVDSQSSVTLESIWGSSANDVWAVGGLGTIRHITPSDVRWQEVASPTTQTMHSVWGSGPNDIWAVGEEGTILHFDGKSFETSTAQLPLGRKPSLRGVWGSSANDVWIVGDGVVLHYTGPKPGAGGGT